MTRDGSDRRRSGLERMEAVLAEVASSYVDVRSLQARIDFARSNLENQDQTLRLTRDRFASRIDIERIHGWRSA